MHHVDKFVVPNAPMQLVLVAVVPYTLPTAMLARHAFDSSDDTKAIVSIFQFDNVGALDYAPYLTHPARRFDIQGHVPVIGNHGDFPSEPFRHVRQIRHFKAHTVFYLF